MKNETQQSFFPFGRDEGASSKTSSRALRFSLVLNHRQWLELLVDEWLNPPPGKTLPLGVSGPLGGPVEPKLHTVIAWIDPVQLANVKVLIRQDLVWHEDYVANVDDAVAEIAWPGPIPLFAIESFSVESDRIRDWLMAMAADLTKLKSEVPRMKAEAIVFSPSLTYDGSSQLPCLVPPSNWNALRGAAAMAVWAVPAVEPWIRVLVGSLSSDRDLTVAEKMGATWINELPWRDINDHVATDLSIQLWRAAREIFSSTSYRSGWNPKVVFGQIVNRSREFGAAGPFFNSFVSETEDVLSDRRGIDVARGFHDPLGLVIQLILLRPTADRFVTWKDELSVMPPVVWWTGAILAGYITGFRDLDVRFSGLPAGRKLLALRTWLIASRETSVDWPDTSTEKSLEWFVEQGVVRMTCGRTVWAERSENNRGRWYRADLQNPEIRRAALGIAETLYPDGTARVIRIADSCARIRGPGHMTLEADTLSIVGEVQVELPKAAQIQIELRDDVFRDWLVRGGIGGHLPPPPFMSGLREEVALPSVPLDATTRSRRETGDVPGLIEIANFLSFQEEQDLVRLIDTAPWATWLKRRVQHYGWRYDYKTGGIDSSARIGPLPQWAAALAERLFESGLIPEMPDQVIVNEYIEDQGISKHVDSRSSFRGPVTTVSLLESWEMIFRHSSGSKIARTMERCSAVILDGPARYDWTHEIPKRQKEPWGLRGRRISLTFRTVNGGALGNSMLGNLDGRALDAIPIGKRGGGVNKKRKL